MISCILFGNFILFNLFLGLISYTFDRTLEESTNKQPAELKKADNPKARLKTKDQEDDLNDKLNQGSDHPIAIEGLESPLKRTQINDSPINSKIAAVVLN